jgi:pimeloyl-ACP methyl ester carboxylesterase
VSLDEQVACLHEVIRTTHDSDTLHILGASWGTIVVAAYAARYPDVPHKLILGSFGLKPSGEMLSVIQRGRALYECDRGRDAAHLIIERFGQQISDGHKDRIVSQFRGMRADQLRCFYEHCDFVQNIGHINELVELSRIKAQTLVINGGNDTILSARDLELAAAQIPLCETRIVEDAGHFLHFEQPDILHIYEAFLEESTEHRNHQATPPIERDLRRFSVARAGRRLAADSAGALDGLAVPDPAR